MESQEKIKDYIDLNGFNIEQFMNKYNIYLYKILNNINGVIVSNEEIEEIISDTFFIVWKNINKTDENTPIKQYLIIIVKNIFKNKYKNPNVNLPIYELENQLFSNVNFGNILDEREDNKEIQLLLKKLKNDKYNMFIMFFYENKSIKAIANNLKISEFRVKYFIHKIRRIMKRKLSKRRYSYDR